MTEVMTVTASPVRSARRIDSLDLLRGSALLGILLVNISAFAYPIYAGLPPATTWWDEVALWLVSFLAEAKFFVLFSFLFGYGLSVQIERARMREQDLGPRYRRRLLGLFGFGLAHAVFLFFGDILMCYAVLGAVLWWMRAWTPRQLLWFTLGMLVVAALAFAVLGSEALVAAGQTPTDVYLASAAQRAYLGSWLDSVLQRVVDLVVVTPFLLLYNWPAALAMFALGLAAGKIGVLQHLDRYWLLFKCVLPWALALGLAGNALYASLPWLRGVVDPAMVWLGMPATAQVAFSGPALTFCFIMALLWAGRAQRFARLRALFRAAGRMSLTNYLGQSVLCGLLFNGVGLALYGQVSPAGLFALAVGLFFLQAIVSRWWLARFRYGPLEWLLRAWTYRAWPPMRG
ncbi:MAG: DUF418 domain-containing protein [Rhodothermales bacterium]